MPKSNSFERNFSIRGATADERSVQICFLQEVSDLANSLWTIHYGHTEIDKHEAVHLSRILLDLPDSVLDDGDCPFAIVTTVAWVPLFSH